MKSTIHHRSLRRSRTSAALWLWLTASASLMAAPVDIAGPPGSGSFGSAVKVLPNGNFVVTDPGYDAPGPVADVGAVYVYTPAGVLISTLTGSTAGDRVGDNGVVVLAGGRFAVVSPYWNGTAAQTGAVTWGNMTNGISGVVSAANSLTGTKIYDQVGGQGVVLLPNGHCLVKSWNWNNTVDSLNVRQAGAVTWCDGTTGLTGPVTTANSLTGSKERDQVGNLVTVLTNGNYVVSSPGWDGAAADVGAVTWGNGATGITGPVSATNSLIGSTASDAIGYSGVTALTNGNYVVTSTQWDNGAVSNAGAVIWGNGTGGTAGIVSAANALTSDRISCEAGLGGVTALTNGNYVVGSPFWEPDAASPADVGAVTWCSGTTGRSGLITLGNSFVGSDGSDRFGSVVALTDGNYVAYSVNWTRPGDANNSSASAGAVTWGNGSTGLTGSVTSGNSLVGDSVRAGVGQNVVPLPGGKFVVVSPDWDDMSAGTDGINAGAVTFCANAAACIGTVSAANSLTGGRASALADSQNQVGSRGVTVLTNGNYVVSSPQWEALAQTPADPVNTGAVTLCNGAGGSTGVAGTGNSVTGSTRYDSVGQVTPLTNGNYVISEPGWDAGSIIDAGFVRWCDGSTAASGPVSAANALTGSADYERVGAAFFFLTEGKVTALSDGNYVVHNFMKDNGALSDAGSVTLCQGTGGTTGPVTAANSVLGTVAYAGYSMVFDYDAPRYQLIVGQPSGNRVTLWAAPPPAAPFIPKLNTPVLLPGGAVRISFTGIPGTVYTMITTKDLDKPYSQWGVLGSVPEISSGQFEYTSPPSTVPRRFFAVQVP